MVKICIIKKKCCSLFVDLRLFQLCIALKPSYRQKNDLMIPHVSQSSERSGSKGWIPRKHALGPNDVQSDCRLDKTNFHCGLRTTYDHDFIVPASTPPYKMNAPKSQQYFRKRLQLCYQQFQGWIGSFSWWKLSGCVKKTNLCLIEVLRLIEKNTKNNVKCTKFFLSNSNQLKGKNPPKRTNPTLFPSSTANIYCRTVLKGRPLKKTGATCYRIKPIPFAFSDSSPHVFIIHTRRHIS